MIEDESTAQKFVDQKAPGKDLVLDVSLIRITKPLPNPEKLYFLKARLQGIEQSLIPEDHRQKITAASDTGPKEAFDVTVRWKIFRASKDPHRIRQGLFPTRTWLLRHRFSPITRRLSIRPNRSFRPMIRLWKRSQSSPIGPRKTSRVR